MSKGNKDDVFISKTLSWLLRHGALKEGLSISSEGFVPVSEIINHKSLRGKCTVTDIERIVEVNNKQRFFLKNNDGILVIRANQGHSLPLIRDLELVPVTDATSIKNVIHGTYFKNLNKIREVGLSRMSRNHIHFAIDLPTNSSIISGIRKDCQVFIFIDIKKALVDGIQFYKSVNGVILSPGNQDGILEPKYFLKICDSKGTILY